MVRFDKRMHGIGADVGASMHPQERNGDNVAQRLEDSERRVREAMARARSRRFGASEPANTEEAAAERA